MSTLLSATTLCMMVIVGLIACGRAGTCLAMPQAAWAAPWLLSVNWNGDEGDKKTGGK